MPLVQQTAPTVEPVDLQTLKQRWGVDFGEADDDVQEAGRAAPVWVGHFLHRAIINRTYDLFLKRWPEGRVIRLPYPPLSSVTSIAYTGTDGSALGSTMSASDYTVESSSEPGRVILDPDASWPALYGDGERHEVRVRYVAGMGATAAAVVTAQKYHILRAISVVGRAMYDDPTLQTESQRYRNEAAEALLWSDRFMGELDGL